MLKIIDFDDNNTKSKWQELYSSNNLLLPYASRPYNELFRKYFRFNGRRLFLKKCVYGLFDDKGCLVMIVPLCIKGRELHIFGDFGDNEILDFIYAKNIDYRYFTELFQELAKRYHGYKLILTRISDESLLHRWLQENKYQFSQQKSCAKLRLPSSYDDYLITLAGNTRYNIRKSEKLIKQYEKPYTFKVFRGPIDKETKEACFRLYDQREFERTGKKRPFTSRYARKKFNALTDTCMKERCSINFCLYFGTQMVAFASGFLNMSENRLISRKTGIDSSFAKLSPGMFLHSQTIKWLINNTDVKCFDLAGGREQYKYWLGCKEYFCYSYEIKL